MKQQQKIKNNYAVEQGFYDWNDLINAFVMFNLEDNDNGKSFKWLNNHENAVIQLIQDEFKKKIADSDLITLENVEDYDNLECNILNTENIK